MKPKWFAQRESQSILGTYQPSKALDISHHSFTLMYVKYFVMLRHGILKKLFAVCHGTAYWQDLRRMSNAYNSYNHVIHRDCVWNGFSVPARMIEWSSWHDVTTESLRKKKHHGPVMSRYNHLPKCQNTSFTSCYVNRWQYTYSLSRDGQVSLQLHAICYNHRNHSTSMYKL